MCETWTFTTKQRGKRGKTRLGPMVKQSKKRPRTSSAAQKNKEGHEESRQTSASKRAQSKSKIGRPGHAQLAMSCSHQGLIFYFLFSCAYCFMPN